MTVFDRIKEIAKKRGMSLKSVNDTANLGTNAIYKWKTQKPNSEALNSVADVLGVSADYLLGNTEDTIPSASNNTQQPVDLTEVADNENWDEWLTSNGRPLTDHDKKVLSALFGSE